MQMMVFAWVLKGLEIYSIMESNFYCKENT
jgi:hypothetical protein